MNAPIPEWGVGIKPAARSAVAAIADAEAEGRVKVIGFNGTPFVLDLIRAGKVEMAPGESLAWAGYAIADAEMRLIGGQPGHGQVHEYPVAPLYERKRRSKRFTERPPGLWQPKQKEAAHEN